jgi:hypothetical protein
LPISFAHTEEEIYKVVEVLNSFKWEVLFYQEV